MACACLALLAGCGGGSGTGPSRLEGDFPRIATPEAVTGCPFPPGTTTYMILGLSRYVVDPDAATLEARVSTAERRTLYLALVGYGCGCHNSEQWESTNPAVASVGQGDIFAYLRPHAPGQTRIFVNFKMCGAGRTYRTTLAYCPPTPECRSLFGDCACPNPRRIDVVTVTP